MGPNILIVDADTRAAQVTGAVIARSIPAATLRVETTPERGWLSFQRERPDVLIIDPSMNSPAGLQFIREVKRSHDPARIFVLTSAPTPGLRRRMSDLGVDMYLEKTAPLDTLIEQLALMSSLPNLDRGRA